MSEEADTAKSPDEGGVALSQIVRLREILGDAQSADLTAKKAHLVMERAGYHGQYEITGFVLCSPDGHRCIVESSAVRWLDRDEMRWLMHDAKSPIHLPNA